MYAIDKVLSKGMHIITIPAKDVSLTQLFPKDIAGSKLVRMNAKGKWKKAKTILLDNNKLILEEDNDFIFQEMETVKLYLKREISIYWEIKFKATVEEICKINDLLKTDFSFQKALYFMQLSQLIYEEESVIKEVINQL